MPQTEYGNHIDIPTLICTPEEWSDIRKDIKLGAKLMPIGYLRNLTLADKYYKHPTRKYMLSNDMFHYVVEYANT